MRFKVFKNTVLLFVLIAISCANRMKTEDGGRKVDELSSNEILKQVQDDKAIVVGANQTGQYLPLLEGKRVGIVANQTSVIFKESLDSIFIEEPFKEIHFSHLEKGMNDYTHLVDSLLALNIDIKKVFSPEHGFRGTADAGELVKDGKDTKTDLSIHSLHGKHKNPNGNYVDGPVLEKKHSSFLGMHPIPLVHGMTIGEYAKMINGEAWLKNELTCNITIVEMQNYNHDSTYSLPIRPSPNLPNDQSITLYPSLGLFEGTNINAGRGTEFQFQRYGAPFLDKNYYQFNYTPEANFGAKYPKHKGEICYGVNLSDIKAERRFTL